MPNSLAFEETVTSARAHQDEDFDPEWIEYSFIAWAQCSNSRCKQKFAIGGTGGVTPEYLPDDNWDYVEYFEPRFCHPMPRVVKFPSKCPDDISTELEVAFRLFWSAPAACAARIRVAMELLMNFLGVPKRKKTSNGRLVDLSLHSRIDAFAAKDTVVGSQLMALKWLGNTGSHDGHVAKSDLLDAFEILEHALVEILEQRSKRMSALAKQLLRKHSR